MGVIKSICCNSHIISSQINQDTIRINEQNKNNINNNNNNNNRNETSNNINEKKGEIISHPTEENKKTIPNEKNEKINKRVSLIQNHQNRRKSISISINQINQLTNETKMKRREKKYHSTIHHNIDFTEIKMKFKETYNILPSNKKLSSLALSPNLSAKKNSVSLINSDDLASLNSIFEKNSNKNNLDIEEINEPFSEKQLITLKNILKKEELIVNEMDEVAINMIINAISYIRVKQKIIIFSNKNDKRTLLLYDRKR